MSAADAGLPAAGQAPCALPVVAVVGPTGSGKSELALELAERFDGEAVNADSMQFYRGMDIGTAKLPAAARRGIPHHLMDFLAVSEDTTVAEFQSMARAAVADIQSRGKLPILTPRKSPTPDISQSPCKEDSGYPEWHLQTKPHLRPVKRSMAIMR